MMKRILTLSALSLLALACSREMTEQETPAQGPDVTVSTLTAYINNDDTRTAYEIDEGQKKAIFSWAEGDAVDAVVKVADVYTGVRFVSQASGVTARFKDGQIPGDVTLAALLAREPGATLAPWAFYPSRVDATAQQAGFAIEWDVRKNFYDADKAKYPGEDYLITVTLPERITPPNGNPLSVVPMLGRMDGEGEYAFVPMTGVLAIPVTGLTGEMDYITLTSEDAALSGSFHVPFASGAISQTTALTAGHSITLTFSGVEGDATFYFPVAAGTIPAGLRLTVGDSEDPETVMTVTTKMAINVETGHIARSPQIAFTPVDQQWAKCADGKFLDDFIWGQHSKFTADTWIDVEIERSGLHPEKYRIANPYPKACTEFGYTPYTVGIEADDYLVFTVDAETGLVHFNAMRLGVEDLDSGGKPMMITHPKDWSASKTGAHNKVVSFDKSGIPAEIQLAAIYSNPSNSGYMYTRDGEGHSSTNRIHLTFSNIPEAWVKVAEGTFIDDLIWDNQGWGATKVPVDLLQSSKDDTKFRVPNPYLIAAEQFSYSTYTAGITGAEYIELSILEDNYLRFATFYAGIEDKPSGGTPMKIWYPTDWGAAYDVTYNKVLSWREDGLPEVMQMAAMYSDVNPSNYGYKYTKYNVPTMHLDFAETEETWTSLGTGRYMDEWFWKNNGFAPYDVEVEIWRSDLDPYRYRVANPYPVANQAFKRTAVDGADEYLFLSVDPSTGLVSYETLRTGMDRSGSIGRNLAAAHPTVWNALKGTSLSAATTKVASGTAAAPLEIQMGGVYYDSADDTHFYTNSTGLKHLWFPDFFTGESWNYLCEGTFEDVIYDEKLNNKSATPTLGTVAVQIQQSSLDGRRYRITNPYRPNVDESLRCAVYDDYLYITIDNGLVYFDPFRAGVIMDASPKELGIVHAVYLNSHPTLAPSRLTSTMTASSVMTTQSDGSPKKIQLGAFYYDVATPNYGYCYPRHDGSYSDQRIFINFNSGDVAIVTPYEKALKSAFHNPVASLSLPSGTLEKMVVKISGGDLSKVTGLRLWQDNIGGWMNSDYVAPDGNGVVTMTSFSNGTVSGGIDLNFWLTGSVVGASYRFDIQQVVVDGVSLPVVQDKDVAHLGGIIVNNGGDTETIGGSPVTISSFRIPALVTSNAGTLIGAYDVRYDNSADLQGDIDVGVKRSTDGGKTWSPLIIAMDMGIYGYESEVAAGTMTEKQAQLNNGIGDPCLLVDETTGRIFCFAVWTHGHYSDADHRSLAYAGIGYEINDTPQFMMVWSDDDGLTWSDPVNITRQIKRYDWRMTFQGPGRGITMHDGTLVIPIQHQEGDSKSMHGLYPLNSGIAYSTDHGLTWHTHAFAHPVTSECAVAEVSPGVLLLTMRDETDSHYRRNYITRDMGRSWTEHASNGKMIDPTCEASILHVNAADNVTGKDLVLFSNPKNTSRSRITIQASEDGGVTWPHSLLVDDGGSLGYTCLTMIDRATVGILYESSRGSIFFQAVPLTDIVR